MQMPNASQAMSNLRDYLISQRKTATDKFPLGKELFAQMLKDTERVDLPIDQIEAAGRADLARNTEALKTECATYLPKGTLDGVRREDGREEAARWPGRGRAPAIDVAQGIRPEEQRRQHSERRSSAGRRRPRPTIGRTRPSSRSRDRTITGSQATYNIAPPDPKWTKAEQAAYIPGEATLLFTSVHEVWPGHFLQFLHSNSNPDKLEAIWIGYAFAEGWAHYCEEMMIEEGLGKGDPEKHIGQLEEALLRDVRLLSSIGLHTEGMTVAQSEKMFKEQAFQDPGNARQQAARGTYDPAYLNYTLGKLMIRKLRADWIAKTRGAAAADDDHALWHDFHDQFLSHGGPPIPLLRKEMVGDSSGLVSSGLDSSGREPGRGCDRPGALARLPRRVSVVRRSAESAAAQADDGRPFHAAFRVATTFGWPDTRLAQCEASTMIPLSAQYR